MNELRATNSIATAEILLSQFLGIVRNLEDSGGSWGNAGAERFGETTASDFSNLIGEANQVYAGLWEQLDVASEELNESGTSADSYMALRREFGRIGILDSDSTTQFSVAASLVAGGIVTKNSTAVDPNTEGIQHAEEVIEGFKASLPDVDWNALESESERWAEESLQVDYTKHIVVGLVLLVVVIVAYIL